MDRQRFAGERSLIDHGLAALHLAVQRDHVPGPNQDHIAGLDCVDAHQNFLSFFLTQPDLVHVQRHGPGQIGDGLAVGPFLHQIADPQQEHDLPGGVEVAAQHAYRNGGGVQHLDRELPAQKAAKTANKIWNGLQRCDDRTQIGGKKQLAAVAAQDLHCHAVHIFMLERPNAVLGQVDLYAIVVEGGKRLDQAIPCGGSILIADHGIRGTLVDLDLRHTGYTLYVCLQDVCFVDRHDTLLQVDAKTPGKVVQNPTIHRSGFVRFFQQGSCVFDLPLTHFLAAELIDLFGLGGDILAVFLDACGNTRDFIHPAQRDGGHLRIYLFGLLAAQHLDAGSPQQETVTQQLDFFQSDHFLYPPV